MFKKTKFSPEEDLNKPVYLPNLYFWAQLCNVKAPKICPTQSVIVSPSSYLSATWFSYFHRDSQKCQNHSNFHRTDQFCNICSEPIFAMWKLSRNVPRNHLCLDFHQNDQICHICLSHDFDIFISPLKFTTIIVLIFTTMIKLIIFSTTSVTQISYFQRLSICHNLCFDFHQNDKNHHA